MSGFQYIFDNAESISIDKSPVVAQSVSRDATVRSVKRSGDTWKFTVKLPNGIRWSDQRPYIQEFENLDRYTTDTIQLNNAGYTGWLNKYLGDSTTTTGWTAQVHPSQSDRLQFVSFGAYSPDASGETVLRAGDIIQLRTKNVYQVKSDVVYSTGNQTPDILVNRVPLETTGTTYDLDIGPLAQWDVVCTQFPNWTIFARDQVSWSGAFVFYEVTR